MLLTRGAVPVRARRDGARALPSDATSRAGIGRPYAFLTLRRPIPNGSLTRSRRKNAAPTWRRFAMADLVYVVLGLLFFGLMGVYALACNRL
jgi:hypothetical protein